MYQIYNEDCLEGMKKIPAGSVDLILTDLPYEMTDCAFDKRLPFEPMWEQFWRVCKPTAAVVLFSVGKFTIELAYSQLKYYRYEWIWRKNFATGFLNAKKMPLRAHENILVFYRTLPIYNPQFAEGKLISRKGWRFSYNYQEFKGGKKLLYQDYQSDKRYPVDVQNFKTPFASAATNFHPTQKPVDLLEYLIRTYTNEGETVLDACMGSGSTGVACMNTGRKFIGFETEKKFFDIAQERVEKALREREGRLFNDTV